ncbi:MAG: HD-GYP domain-containing protein [Syntrophomonas sp.]
MPALETIGNFLLLFTTVSCMLLIVFLVLKLFGKQHAADNKAEFSLTVALSSAVALWALLNLNEYLTSPWTFQCLSLILIAFFFAWYVKLLVARKNARFYKPHIFYTVVFISILNFLAVIILDLNNPWFRVASVMCSGLVIIINTIVVCRLNQLNLVLFYKFVPAFLYLGLTVFLAAYCLYLINGSIILRFIYIITAFLMVIILFVDSMDQLYFFTTRNLNQRIDLLQEEYAAEMEMVEDVVISLARTIDAKDRYTEGHTERVSQYSVFLGEKAGLSEKRLENLRMGALIHDIGKIGIDQDVLNKPGKLDDQERQHIETHPLLGERICTPLKAFKDVRSIIRSHHEKLDGSGYPDGLRGDAINLETRIVTIADIFDALTTERSYRQALSIETAITIMKEEAALGKLDAELIALFETVLSDMGLLN